MCGYSCLSLRDVDEVKGVMQNNVGKSMLLVDAPADEYAFNAVVLRELCTLCTFILCR